MTSDDDVRKFLTTFVAQAKAALAGIEKPGYLQMSRLNPVDESLIPTRYRLDDVENMICTAISDSNAGHNVYIEGRTVCGTLRGNERGKEKDTHAVFALVVDSDADKQLGWIPTIRPSMTVETSPGNFQFWFFFKQAIDVKTAKRLGERIRRATGSDSDTGNPVQPYRVAGTINYPNKTKINRGRIIVPTQLGEFDVEILKTPEDIEAAFLVGESPSEPEAVNGGDGQPIEIDETTIPGETLRVIRNGVENEDRSYVFYNVVLTLAENGWTLDGIAALLERYPHGIAQKYRGRLYQEVKRVYSKIKSSKPALSLLPPSPSPPPPLFSLGAAPSPGGVLPSSTLEDTLQVFERWLLLPSRIPVYAMLGTVAANLLPGDPVWLGIVAPPSSAKTELLNSIAKMPFVVSVSTLTLAGLLSGTPRRQQAQGAQGGLLRQIGSSGLLCLKDFTSTLAMRPDAKAEVLAALREIYDGKWTRHLGSDGGKTLHWEGKLGLIFGCTGVIDTHHSVSDALGNRFLLSRLEPGKEQLRWALRHTGRKITDMRHELAESVNALFFAPRAQPITRDLSEDETVHLERVTDLVVRLRGAVERDRYRRDLDAVYGAEGPARLGLTLERLLAGLDVLGLAREQALEVATAIALDSVPPLRRRIYWFLCQPLDPIVPRSAAASQTLPRTTADVAVVAGLPTTTVRRALEELQSYGLAERYAGGLGLADSWRGIVLP